MCLKMIRSISYSDIGKRRSLVKNLPSDRSRCVISWIYMRILTTGFCKQTGSEVCYSPFPIQDGWKPMYSHTLSKSNQNVFNLFLVSVSSLVMRVLAFSYCSKDCEGKNISTNVFRCGAESAHLFDLQFGR